MKSKTENQLNYQQYKRQRSSCFVMWRRTS